MLRRFALDGCGAAPHVAGLAEWLKARFDFDPTRLHEYMATAVQHWSGSIAGTSGQMLLNTAGAVLRFFLMLFILFFALRDGQTGSTAHSALLPIDRPEPQAHVHAPGQSHARGGVRLRADRRRAGLWSASASPSQGCTGPVVFGVLAAVARAAAVRRRGAGMGAGALYLFGIGPFRLGIFMLVWGGIVSVSDNFVRPMIISRYTPVPTLLVFLGVVGGVSAFGPIGFIFGPVMLVLATELLRFAEESLARRD